MLRGAALLTAGFDVAAPSPVGENTAQFLFMSFSAVGFSPFPRTPDLEDGE